jgi:two-component system chemotaxis response regulator CheB
MTVKKFGDRLRLEVNAGEKVSGHCPSVDVLFHSVAAACGADAVGVILTGMGSDGARGLAAMRQMGARTIGQDKAPCIVYGMPKVAYELGAVEKQVPLENIAQAIINAVSAER